MKLETCLRLGLEIMRSFNLSNRVCFVTVADLFAEYLVFLINFMKIDKFLTSSACFFRMHILFLVDVRYLKMSKRTVSVMFFMFF